MSVMDYLAASGLEPQLAIPVIVVVVGALLVYIFGFQKSEEPSWEHLAVLQSTSSYKTRSVSTIKSKNNNNNTKTREKPSQNGHIVHDKERNVAAKKKENPVNNKENKPPRTPQATPTPAAAAAKKQKTQIIRPEDFDSGEWIQAVSRKDKKKQVKKEEPKEKSIIIPKADLQTGKDKETPSPVAEPQAAAGSADADTVLKETQVQVQSQTTQTTPKPSPEKKAKKGAKDAATTTSVPTSQESTPVKQKSSGSKEAKQENNKKAPEVVNVNGVSGESQTTPEASPAKKLSVSEDAPAPAEPKGYVAFDEMGDTNVDAWEEAKSRGNKKRRARKD